MHRLTTQEREKVKSTTKQKMQDDNGRRRKPPRAGQHETDHNGASLNQLIRNEVTDCQKAKM